MSAIAAARKPARVLGLALAAALVATVALAAAPLQASQAAGGIIFDGSPGSAAPPATLGPYTVTPFPPDPQPVMNWATDVPATSAGLAGPCLRFEPNPVYTNWLLNHVLFNDTYFSSTAVWGHGYAGDAYIMQSFGGEGCPDQLVMTLPPDTYAFYFYGHAYSGSMTMTVTANDTSFEPVALSATEGAKYFGFYSADTPISTITIDVPAHCTWAVGEFGIYMGEPASGVPADVCTRSDVAAVIYGGWDGIPVKAYVGGTEQQTLYTARDAFGNPAVLWTFYPPASGWDVSVAPQTPPGLDPARWQYKLVAVGVGRPAKMDYDPESAGARIYRCSEKVFYFQLIDTGALPAQ